VSGDKPSSAEKTFSAFQGYDHIDQFAEHKNITFGMGVNALEPQPIQDTTLALTPSPGTDL
jgi:hypothetical protein